jgi:hypothetical protein
MECPRCAGLLTIYALEDARAVVCEECEYVGVPADLSPASDDEQESWDDALNRFHSEKTGS